MSADSPDVTATDLHELVLERLMHASPAALFRCWTEPELMKQWFTPRPWTTPVIETDVRPGGSTYMVMRGPAGDEMVSRGVYLDIVPGEKLVFTDAYVRAWEPSANPFFTGIITFAETGGKTLYTARARHWNAADREKHEAMGFHEGWGKAAEQLEATARRLTKTAR